MNVVIRREKYIYSICILYVLMRHIMEDFKLPPFRINGNFAYFFDVIKHSIDRDMHLN